MEAWADFVAVEVVTVPDEDLEGLTEPCAADVLPIEAWVAPSVWDGELKRRAAEARIERD